MSCPNFETQENFKLFLWNFKRPTDEVLNENILETDENKYILETDEDITSIEDITESTRDKYAERMYEWDYGNFNTNYNTEVANFIKKYYNNKVIQLTNK